MEALHPDTGARPPHRLSSGAVGWLLAALLLTGLSVTWRDARPKPGIDFYQFWVVGQEIARGEPGNVYSDESRRRLGAEFARRSLSSVSVRQRKAAEAREVLETYSTPFLYSVFGLLSGGDYDRDLQAFRLLSLASLVLAIAGFCRWLHFSGIATACAILALTAWFGPLRSDLRVANVGCIQMGLLACFLWARKRSTHHRSFEVLGGVILGLSLTFKPNLALVALLLLLSRIVARQHSTFLLEAAGALAAAVLALFLSSFVFGSFSCWGQWLSALAELPEEIISVEAGNFALAAVLPELLQADVSEALIALPLPLAVAAIWIGGRIRRRRRAAEAAEAGTPATPDLVADILTIALGCLAMLLSFRLAWVHYFVFAIPIILFLLRPIGGAQLQSTAGGPSRRLLAICALCALSTTPLVALGVLRGTDAMASLFCAATLLLFGLACWEALRGEGPQVTSSIQESRPPA